jgi:hypothetical protein
MSCLLLLLVSRLASDIRDIKQDESSSLTRPHQVRIPEETSEDTEEAELDEAWDLNVAEDSSPECLSEHEEENDGSE